MSDAAPSSATDAVVAAEAAPSVAKANDLDAIKRSVEDAASVSGSLWLSYLFMMFYLAVAAGAVSHVDLFVENPVKLPFLGVELPLKAFFLLAPILFCISHVYTLTYFVILSDKAKRYHRELKAQIAGDDDPDSAASLRAQGIRNELQRQLPSNIFVQFLAGPDDIRASALGFILKVIAWFTLVFAPILLLLLLQVQFLPYHDEIVTWTARLSILFDILIVWWLWPAILVGRGETQRGLARNSFVGTFISVGLGVVVILFSWTVATFPGERIDGKLLDRPFISDVDKEGQPKTVSLHDYLFDRPINDFTRRRGIFLSSTLVLPHFDILDQPKSKERETHSPYQYVFTARGRNLRGAVFVLSKLGNVDFEGADLEGASFELAQLSNSSLYCAKLEGATFLLSQIQGVWFHGARMQGVDLSHVQGQGAIFEGAQLQGADLRQASFQGASFNSADLESTDMEGAHLEGASFQVQADLGGGCITPAQNHGGADLGSATLDKAHLEAASFRGARLAGAVLGKAEPDDSTDFAQSRPDAAPVNAAALAKNLERLVCSKSTSSLFVLRGLLATGRLKDAGPSARGLAQAIGAAECGLPEALSANDKAYLFEVEHSTPPPAAK